MKGILGRKVGMTEVFTKNGKLIPVTVVQTPPNVVMQVKTTLTDGYDAIQLGITDKKEKNASKASQGHAKKASTNPKRFLKEIRNVEGTYNIGDTIGADIFTVGEYVDVTGTNKGKGFQGVIKRHNQTRGPMTHGSRFHRRPGSMGTMLPMRVMPGKKLPGHMGTETTTIQNLEIIEINLVDNYILISGNIPGPKDGLVLIKSAIKKTSKEAEDLYFPGDQTTTPEVLEGKECTCTDECASGYNPNCTCESEECHCTEQKEENIVEETHETEEVVKETAVETSTEESGEEDGQE